MAPPKQPRKQPIVLRGDGEMREEWDGSGALMMTSDEEAACPFGGGGAEREGDEAPRVVTVKLTQLASDRWRDGTRVAEPREGLN